MNDSIENVKTYLPVINRESNGGIQQVYRFDNGYGASIINHNGSYGVELAVVEWDFWNDDDEDYTLCYSTPITGDVLGWLEYDELVELLDKIIDLPNKEDSQGAVFGGTDMGEIM